MSMKWYTCLTCRVSFTTAELQRDHYKLEWHSYNLKRKLVQLPAVTYEQFERIEAQHLIQQNDNKEKSFNKTEDTDKKSFYCDICRKQFNNENAFSQHIQSKRHHNLIENKETRNAIGLEKGLNAKIKSKTDSSTAQKIENQLEAEEDNEDSDWESVDSDEDNGVVEDPIAPNDCLFCDNSSDSIDENMSHMSVKHSFFIPDVEYLTDLEPLLEYLGEKIVFGHYCLYCCDGGKQFRSKKSAQQHMIDKGHTKIKYQQSGDSLVEYSNFYDYSKSYPDFDHQEVDNEEEVSIPNLEDEDWQLTLPSGAVIGHRSLFRYYKQNLKPLTETTSQTKSSAILGKVMSQYRSLGWTGITGEAAVQKAKDIKFMQRIQRRYDLKIGIKHNRVMQTHFRSQIGF